MFKGHLTSLNIGYNNWTQEKLLLLKFYKLHDVYIDGLPYSYAAVYTVVATILRILSESLDFFFLYKKKDLLLFTWSKQRLVS